MPFYQRRGEVPRKRHIVFRENGTAPDRGGHGPRGLHRQRVDPLPPRIAVPREGARCLHADRARGVGSRDARAPSPEHVRRRRPRATRSPAAGTLMWNSDVEISLLPPGALDGLLLPERRGRRGRSSSTRARGTLETIFGDVPYKDGDYVVIPRGTTYRFMPEGPQRYLVFETPGLIEIPRRYRNQYGQILEGAPYYHRDIHPPTEPPHERGSAASSSSRCASAAATRSTSSTTTPSTSSAGTASSTRGRSRSTTSSRSRAASTSRRPRTRRSRARTS